MKAQASSTRAGVSMVKAYIDKQFRVEIPEARRADFRPGQRVQVSPADDQDGTCRARREAMARAVNEKLKMRDPVGLDLSDFNSDTSTWDVPASDAGD